MRERGSAAAGWISSRDHHVSPRQHWHANACMSRGGAQIPCIHASTCTRRRRGSSTQAKVPESITTRDAHASGEVDVQDDRSWTDLMDVDAQTHTPRIHQRQDYAHGAAERRQTPDASNVDTLTQTRSIDDHAITRGQDPAVRDTHAAHEKGTCTNGKTETLVRHRKDTCTERKSGRSSADYRSRT
jgi:hypothetical protein